MKAELLAPAGSYESMRAAYAAGADAVYIGGTRFGARAYADNLDREMMLRAIDYAHLKKKKLYLTVNTLLKDAEMEELYEYLAPFYMEGLDAVIVQDLGVLRYIKRTFPGMDIHASTQMTVTGAYGAEMLKEEGVSRVVTARELSLKEIKNIYDRTGMEIESFIHGALCYCYSGQCLYSSMIGGRSGNRGRCAQPCRLPYDLLDGRTCLNAQENKYLLSPKDMCTLEILPEILRSGVYSLKIEGRMKRAEYTAGVVSIYRKYLDAYLENPQKKYRVEKEDLSELMDLYNRGGFSKGYYMRQNGREMMSLQRPNHWGTKAAKVISCGKGRIRCRALEPLWEKDVLEYRELRTPLSFTLQQKVNTNQEFSLPVPGKIKINPGLLYRTKNEKLLEDIGHSYMEGKAAEKINGKLILSREKCAILTLNYDNLQVETTGEIPQPAQKRPLTREDVEKQIRKTGDTEFQFAKLEIEMEKDLFLPMQALNDLRRRAVSALTKAVTDRSRRETGEEKRCGRRADSEKDGKSQAAPYLAVSVENEEGLDIVLRYPEVEKVYLDSRFFENRQALLKRSEEVVQRCHRRKKQCFYVMPWIFRDKAEIYFSGREVTEALENFDGVLLKNLEEYRFLNSQGYAKELAADHNLYAWNQEARLFLREKGILYDTVPLELNAGEIQKRGCAGSEMIVYGYLPLMVSAQCQLKNSSGCIGKAQNLFLLDRRKKRFMVRNHCAFCYNVIYNHTPLELQDNAEEILSFAPLGVRLQFGMEDAKTVEEVLVSYISAFYRRTLPERVPGEFTRGHFKRGVE